MHICTQMYCPLSSALRISITAVNIDVEGGNVERESQEAVIEVTTEPVGPPQVPDTPSVISITNTTGTDDTVMRTNTTDLSLVLTDLAPLTRYNARVRSQNFNGFSAFSEAEDFSTFGMFLCAYLWYSLWYIHYSPPPPPPPPPSFPHLPLTPLFKLRRCYCDWIKWNGGVWDHHYPCVHTNASYG